MLSNTSTLYLVDLCDKYPDNKYIVAEWDDLNAINTHESESFDLQDVWKDLKMNGCLINKYKDEDEVCFTLTDKSRVLVQEYKLLIEKMANQSEDSAASSMGEGFIKTDESGSLVFMQNGNELVKKRKFEIKKIKKGAMSRGFLGGLISGGIFGLLFGLLGGIIANLLM